MLLNNPYLPGRLQRYWVNQSEIASTTKLLSYLHHANISVLEKIVKFRLVILDNSLAAQEEPCQSTWPVCTRHLRVQMPEKARTFPQSASNFAKVILYSLQKERCNLTARRITSLLPFWLLMIQGKSFQAMIPFFTLPRLSFLETSSVPLSGLANSTSQKPWFNEFITFSRLWMAKILSSDQ